MRGYAYQIYDHIKWVILVTDFLLYFSGVSKHALFNVVLTLYILRYCLHYVKLQFPF